MFQLIWNYIKRVPYYIFGLAIITGIFRFLSSWLKSRTIDKSRKQLLKDEQDHLSKSEKIEQDWIESGQKTDKFSSDK